MLDRLLPAAAVCREAFDDAEAAPLFPEEERAVGAAVDKRRREYATVRRCAREALAALGLPPGPVLSGPKREPLWPDGVVGSLTHCAGYRAAALARARDLASIGVDAEPNEPLPDGVLASIALPEELAQTAELAAAGGAVCWDRLLFSAKESIYKAWYPLARRWLGFEEARVTVDPDAGTFTAALLVAGPVLADGAPLAGFSGRWLVDRGLVVTAIAVPAVPTA